MTGPAGPRLLRARFAALQPRERLFVGAGAAAVLAFAAILSGGADEAEDMAPVELGDPSRAAGSSAPPLPVASPPSGPLPPATAPAPANAFVLRGVLARSAILAMPDGSQRTVPVGREFQPGLTLKSVAVDHVVLASPGGDLRLDLNRFAGAAPAAGATPVAAPAAQAVPANPAAHRQATTAFRLGMAARKAGGNVTGYVVKPGARLPILGQAGLRPGDVLLAVNGQALDGEERLFGMSEELASVETSEIEFERGGQRMKAKVRFKN
ncbi:type II secretion system protein N [Sphingomonas sp. LY54]|uniref:type II secretion system protein N n=1 Tax=Sphingomonas sp. LY54 TaxID=3095343 RepID=UPI002D799C05|nr:type II secretion system protein N [Sphingomonas sp. LY54]WRP29326.1 type II secretion system protein N [Sphingomonas sp. LY54]